MARDLNLILKLKLDKNLKNLESEITRVSNEIYQKFNLKMKIDTKDFQKQVNDAVKKIKIDAIDLKVNDSAMKNEINSFFTQFNIKSSQMKKEFYNLLSNMDTASAKKTIDAIADYEVQAMAKARQKTQLSASNEAQKILEFMKGKQIKLPAGFEGEKGAMEGLRQQFKGVATFSKDAGVALDSFIKELREYAGISKKFNSSADFVVYLKQVVSQYRELQKFSVDKFVNPTEKLKVNNQVGNALQKLIKDLEKIQKETIATEQVFERFINATAKQARTASAQPAKQVTATAMPVNTNNVLPQSASDAKSLVNEFINLYKQLGNVSGTAFRDSNGQIIAMGINVDKLNGKMMNAYYKINEESGHFELVSSRNSDNSIAHVKNVQRQVESFLTKIDSFKASKVGGFVNEKELMKIVQELYTMNTASDNAVGKIAKLNEQFKSLKTGASAKFDEANGITQRTKAIDAQMKILLADVEKISKTPIGAEMSRIDPKGIQRLIDRMKELYNSEKDVSQEAEKITRGFKKFQEVATSSFSQKMQQQNNALRTNYLQAQSSALGSVVGSNSYMSGIVRDTPQALSATAMKKYAEEYMRVNFPQYMNKYSVEYGKIGSQKIGDTTGETATAKIIMRIGTELKTVQILADRATGSISALSHNASKIPLSQMNFGQLFASAMEKFPIWMGATTVWMQFINQVRDGIQYIYQMDTAMTELAKVTGFSNEKLDEMRGTAVQLGKELGHSSVDVMKSMAEFGRITKVQSEINELSKVATVASNVTSMSAMDSAKALNMTMISFKKDAKDAMGILDSWNEIQNNFRKLMRK